MNHKTKFRLLKVLGLILVPIVVFSLHFAQMAQASNVTAAMVTAARAIAYRNSPYANAQFFADQANQYALTWDERAMHYRGDHHSKYYNVVNGWRVVTDAPAKWTNTVYIVGSSTVWDWLVPDWYTKASYLQRDFNAAGYSYRIVIRAVSGQAMYFYPDLLKEDVIQRGDIVIFYGGFIAGNADLYKKVVREENATAHAQGATFYNFLEPEMYTIPLSADDKVLIANRTLVSADSTEKEKALWLAIEPAERELEAQGIASFDLTHILDGARLQGASVYIDDSHTNEYGNAIIAQAIYDAITVY